MAPLSLRFSLAVNGAAFWALSKYSFQILQRRKMIQLLARKVIFQSQCSFWRADCGGCCFARGQHTVFTSPLRPSKVAIRIGSGSRRRRLQFLASLSSAKTLVRELCVELSNFRQRASQCYCCAALEVDAKSKLAHVRRRSTSELPLLLLLNTAANCCRPSNIVGHPSLAS